MLWNGYLSENNNIMCCFDHSVSIHVYYVYIQICLMVVVVVVVIVYVYMLGGLTKCSSLKINMNEYIFVNAEAIAEAGYTR